MNMLARLVIHLAVCTISATTVFGADIDACKYLIIGDFVSDPYGIANELRAQATTRGFQMLTSVPDVPPEEGLKACSMMGSWQANGAQGYVSMRVLDASGGVIGEASATATAWISAKRAVRSVVNKIYSQLGYTGFNEQTFKEVLERKYPKLPTLAITEETIKKTERTSSVEGTWTDAEDRYRLGIVRAPESSGADYVAVVLATHSAVWQPGEIKAQIRDTAAPDVFTCTYFHAEQETDRHNLDNGARLTSPRFARCGAQRAVHVDSDEGLAEGRRPNHFRRTGGKDQLFRKRLLAEC